MLTLKIPEKLERLFLSKKRFKVAYGGRGAGKSQTFADIDLFDVQTNGLKVGCFRELQNSIEDSVHSLFKAEISRMGLEDFTIHNSRIFHKDGGEIKYRGLAKNPDAIQSMHGFKRFWVEEAQAISKLSLKKLTPTLRERDSQLWFSLNPQSSEDPISKRFLLPFKDELAKNGYFEDDLHCIVKINYYDNPWFPQVLEDERQWDFDNLERAEYDWIWLGEYNDKVDNNIIKKEWFDACIDAHKKLGFKPRGEKVVTHDVADTGDARSMVYRHGNVILEATENTVDDVNEACDWALDTAISNKVDVFRWDVAGLGLTLKRQVAKSLQGKRILHQQYNGANSPENPHIIYEKVEGDSCRENITNGEYFYDKNAQCVWALRNMMYRTYQAVEKKIYHDPSTLISISSGVSDISKLRSETCRIPKKSNGSGTIQVMGKTEMKSKYKVESPNLFDALKMQFDEQTVLKSNFLTDIKIDRSYVY